MDAEVNVGVKNDACNCVVNSRIIPRVIELTEEKERQRDSIYLHLLQGAGVWV